jgi:phosphoribosylglycinamide formyltransferase 1
MRIVILISGRGSNMEAIIAATRRPARPLPVTIAAVISNRPNAAGLIAANAVAIPTHVVDHKEYSERTDFDTALAAQVAAYAPDFVVLAGFMRVLGPAFLSHFPKRVINIHPSLLPAFPGLHTHAAALASGARFAGATVHFVTEAVDVGAAIIQAAVPILANDTVQTLSNRVLIAEHRIYPQALAWLAEGRVRWCGDVLQITTADVEPVIAYSPALD